ncbi:hypothetical protein SARC_07670 [Sphaeroforma arctica JP610]|uniref:Uncharacterized protein n=1 Tax=Sphaeroforma arctica JP610 TaxID=667725 RepID=A0A0L0FTD8_9EUKA|nr:hypothetical protein SARC_07670 [Sphaeroforma arctica JP610]KNC79954.1 hypothetical protein SARC_07670 [Sphaeroforma arctica JP610]|eukprot:XP_014153856.1 hypothetical protein SARC_07670 [Sphaeroforma arctica JP610]
MRHATTLQWRFPTQIPWKIEVDSEEEPDTSPAGSANNTTLPTASTSVPSPAASSTMDDTVNANLQSHIAKHPSTLGGGALGVDVVARGIAANSVPWDRASVPTFAPFFPRAVTTNEVVFFFAGVALSTLIREFHDRRSSGIIGSRTCICCLCFGLQSSIRIA